MKVKFKRLPLLVAKLLMDKEVYLMFKWFNEKGFSANMEETRSNFPDVKPTAFDKWLVNENWDRWNKKGTV